MPSHATASRAAFCRSSPTKPDFYLSRWSNSKIGYPYLPAHNPGGECGPCQGRLPPAFVRHLPARLRQLPASAAVFCQGYGLDPDPPRPGRLPGPAPPGSSCLSRQTFMTLQLRITVLQALLCAVLLPPSCFLGSPASFAGQAFATQATAPPGSSVFPLIRASPARVVRQAPLGVVLDASRPQKHGGQFKYVSSLSVKANRSSPKQHYVFSQARSVPASQGRPPGSAIWGGPGCFSYGSMRPAPCFCQSPPFCKGPNSARGGPRVSAPRKHGGQFKYVPCL